ncbi:hypothetical protein [Parachlamydia sp. AcF125]|uniref:hypothetical protein n=1 Tax=Parachlamydia sp. AcF125 TaxID=2795736 RepID=UPI001BC9EB9A|nr:hypothetical protein [Parachlamydia sp. AcF125]MBS4168991.1 hypothetical protein [Parachlamydia sp. AcF125]
MKYTLYLPIELVELFKDLFAYPEKPLFGSVATIQNHCPRIRTMRIYEFNQDGCPILLTHTGSNKWKEFVNQPQIFINIVNESKLLQIIVSVQLVLDTSESAYETAKRYWNMVRSDVKKIYDLKHKIEEAYCEFDDLIIPEETPNTFRIACAVPSFWEALHLESEYTKSHRYQFYLKEGSWLKQRIHVG